jgi:ATP/ADP translocase
MGERIGSALEVAGYPKGADPQAVNLPLLITVLLLFVVAATALYGPQASALVEMFPTRVRYTAMSLPYHVGTGWVGGFLPVTGVALVAITGDIYAALWYPILFTAISAICTIFLLKETKGKPLEEV